MFNKILNIFKKQPKEEPKNVTPNLMAADPSTGGAVNLMAADPINAIPAEPITEKPSEFIEEPGLENQMVERMPENNTPIILQVSEPEGPASAPTMDAFSMSTPDIASSQNTPYTPEAIFEKSLTSKICKNCGTPNDPLIKFCVSCGNLME